MMYISGLPILLLTDHETEFERSVGERVGSVLEKPFGSIVLGHAINALICRPPQVVPQTTAGSRGLNGDGFEPEPSAPKRPGRT